MKQSICLAWKEWREARAYLFIGLGIFLGLPIIAGIEDHLSSSRHFTISVIPWVGCFGGLLAIFVAVGASCRDLTGRVDNFWQAIPITLARFLRIKFLVGLLVVLAACSLPLLAESLINQRYDAVRILPVFDGYFAGIYGIAFAAGCLLRRTAHAAMVALVASLLIYGVTSVLLPALLSNLGETISDGYLLALMLLFVIVPILLGYSLALAAVRRQWQIESGRKLIYVTLSVVLLATCVTLRLKLGTNLPIVQRIDLPEGAQVYGLNPYGTRVDIAATKELRDFDSKTNRWDFKTIDYSRQFEVTPAGLQPVQSSREKFVRPTNLSYGIPMPDQSMLNYEVSTSSTEFSYTPGPLHLYAYQYREKADATKTFFDVPLWDVDKNSSGFCVIWNGKLYVIGLTYTGPRPQRQRYVSHLAMLDISDRFKPKLLFDQAVQYPLWTFDPQAGYPPQLKIPFPDIPEVSKPDRFEFALSQVNHAQEGDLLCFGGSESLVAYHLDQLTEHEAVLTRIGVHQQSNFLGQLFGRQPYDALTVRNGLVYDRTAYGTINTRYTVQVYDTRSPQPMRLVGHFAVPSASQMCVLPDGRMLLGGGNQVWLVGLPPEARRR